MDIRNKIKSLIAQNGTTLNKVCSIVEQNRNEKVSPNNITNKLRRQTIKFNEVQDILEALGYHIEFVKNK